MGKTVADTHSCTRLRRHEGSYDKHVNKRENLKELGYQEGAKVPMKNFPVPAPLEKPPFTLGDIRRAIPARLFERSLRRSMGYLGENLAIVAVLFYSAYVLSCSNFPIWLNMILWPIYWYVQGVYLTGLWVIAHECGHEAFSPYGYVNDTIGLILHSLLLVPYHNWRITHRRHHSNTGSCENDEVFVPATRSSLPPPTEWSEYLEDSPIYNFAKAFWMLLAGWMPGYLIFNASGPAKYLGKDANHFSPFAEFYLPKEVKLVVLSNITMVLCAMCYVYACWMWSFNTFGLLFGVPYLIVNAFLVLITYLQHTAIYIPHYRETEWTWLRGALCTVDRSFGTWLDNALHHITDTHVCHHLFSKLPFYHAMEATKIIQEIIGPYYLSDQTPILSSLLHSHDHCRFVEDDGGVVFYKRNR